MSKLTQDLSETNNGHPKPRANRAVVNRANSKHSTGPRTEAGKQRSSMNALRHGLTARAILLPSEDPAAYQHHVQEFFDTCQPKGAIEKELVQSIADTAWRLNRLVALEADLFAIAAPGTDDARTLDSQTRAFTNLSMHGQRLSRQLRETRSDLRELQKERRELEARQLAEAADLLQMDQEKGVAFDPAADGFVFSTEEIETYIRRRKRAKAAEKAADDRAYDEECEEDEA